MSQAYTPGSYVLGLFLTWVLFLALSGFLIGYVLARKVRGKYMAFGSLAYWVFTFLLLFYYWPAYWLTFLILFAVLVLFADITYAVSYIAGKRKKQERPSTLAQTPHV